RPLARRARHQARLRLGVSPLRGLPDHLGDGAVQGAQALAHLHGDGALEGEPARPRGAGLRHPQGEAEHPRGGGHPHQHERRLSAQRPALPHLLVGAPQRAVYRSRPALHAPLRPPFSSRPPVIRIRGAMHLSAPYRGPCGGYRAASLLAPPIVLMFARQSFAAVPRHWLAFVSFGLFAALNTVTQGHAYLLTLSSYVEAVKQVEILFALAIGVVLFHERQKLREITPGAMVMLAGGILLSLAA